MEGLEPVTPAEPRPHRVSLSDEPQPWWVAALFPAYLVLALVFAAWRCAITNWHVWFGPPALLADLFALGSLLLLLWQLRRPVRAAHHPASAVTGAVDCLVPTHTEPVSVIEPTVVGALQVRGVRRVLVLGNRHRPEVAEMARRLGAHYSARDSEAQGKAGNLNAGLAHTDAEFVITLDADHIPCPDLLERTLGQLADPSVALVQTPQSFYNTDSFAFRRTRRGWWSEGGMFYQHVQPAKNRWNASFYVGTSAVLRRSALDDIGGFGTGTVTEDIHTALRLHARGWRTVFLSEPVAFGLEAASLREFYGQRRRWAVGSLQLLLRHPDSPLRRRGLTLAQRTNYLHAVSVHFGGLQRLTHLALPAVVLLSLTSPVAVSIGWFALLFLGFTVVSWLVFGRYARGGYHPLHSEGYSMVQALAQTAALPALLRRERRQNAANKTPARDERTWLKPALWLMLLVAVFPVGYGGWLAAGGRADGLVLSAALWGGVHAVWLASMLLFLMRYERRPAPDYERLSAPARYAWVMAEGAAQLQPSPLSPLDPARPAPALEAA